MVKDRDDGYYLRIGRIITVVGVLIGIGTAFIASGYSNIMNYIQLLFSYFNAPLFATFIIAMYWKRTSPWSGFGAIAAFVVDAVVTVIVTLVTTPKPEAELAGLVHGVPGPNAPDPREAPRPVWWQSPKLLGAGALGITLVLSLIFL